ncbi:MAG: pilus motility taxis protein HmpF [Thermosynechococcaceae cyanobacterium]
MLYLAEINKKSGFMGAKTELKLLARKQSEHNWVPVPGEEILSFDSGNDYNQGVLVLVELDANQNVKNVQDATRQLVGILKNFSRMRERFKTQEEEIEGWKQSLIYQSQELTRREVDMEARAEELQQFEAESQKIAQQRQEFEESRDQILQLKEQLEGDRQQLEEAWGKLQTAQRDLDTAQSASLSDDQIHQIEALLQTLEASIGSGGADLSLVEQQQAHFNQYWQSLEQDRSQAQQQQDSLTEQLQKLEQSWRSWNQAQASVDEAQLEFRVQERLLEAKSESLTFLTTQLQAQADVGQALQMVRDGFTGSKAVNLQSLRSMSLEELEKTVGRLQKELDKLSSFVNDQEEELQLQLQTIEELEAQVEQASEYDRLSLAGDLEQEQQQYRLLNETLEGQRKTLQEREGVLHLHQDILSQRQKGKDSRARQSVEVKLEPILQQLEAQQEEGDQQIQVLKNEIARLQVSAQNAEEALKEQLAKQQGWKEQLQAKEQELNQQRAAVAQQQERVKTLEEVLQPLQDVIDSVRGSNGNGSAPQGNVQETVAELKQVLMALGKVPDLAPAG